MRYYRRVLMNLLKRAAVTTVELLVELLLIGALLSLISIRQVRWSEIPVLILASSLIAFIVLLANFYYFARPVIGILWTGKAPWHYGVIAGFVFAAAASIAYVRDWQTISSTARISVAWFLPGATTIVAICAECGRHILRTKLFGNG
jgi:hypothetical protein